MTVRPYAHLSLDWLEAERAFYAGELAAEKEVERRNFLEFRLDELAAEKARRTERTEA